MLPDSLSRGAGKERASKIRVLVENESASCDNSLYPRIYGHAGVKVPADWGNPGVIRKNGSSPKKSAVSRPQDQHLLQRRGQRNTRVQTNRARERVLGIGVGVTPPSYIQSEDGITKHFERSGSSVERARSLSTPSSYSRECNNIINSVQDPSFCESYTGSPCMINEQAGPSTEPGYLNQACNSKVSQDLEPGGSLESDNQLEIENTIGSLAHVETSNQSADFSLSEPTSSPGRKRLGAAELRAMGEAERVGILLELESEIRESERRLEAFSRKKAMLLSSISKGGGSINDKDGYVTPTWDPKITSLSGAIMAELGLASPGLPTVPCATPNELSGIERVDASEPTIGLSAESTPPYTVAFSSERLQPPSIISPCGDGAQRASGGAEPHHAHVVVLDSAVSESGTVVIVVGREHTRSLSGSPSAALSQPAVGAVPAASNLRKTEPETEALDAVNMGAVDSTSTKLLSPSLSAVGFGVGLCATVDSGGADDGVVCVGTGAGMPTLHAVPPDATPSSLPPLPRRDPASYLPSCCTSILSQVSDPAPILSVGGGGVGSGESDWDGSGELGAAAFFMPGRDNHCGSSTEILSSGKSSSSSLMTDRELFRRAGASELSDGAGSSSPGRRRAAADRALDKITALCNLHRDSENMAENRVSSSYCEICKGHFFSPYPIAALCSVCVSTSSRCHICGQPVHVPAQDSSFRDATSSGSLPSPCGGSGVERYSDAMPDHESSKITIGIPTPDGKQRNNFEGSSSFEQELSALEALSAFRKPQAFTTPPRVARLINVVARCEGIEAVSGQDVHGRRTPDLAGPVGESAGLTVRKDLERIRENGRDTDRLGPSIDMLATFWKTPADLLPRITAPPAVNGTSRSVVLLDLPEDSQREQEAKDKPYSSSVADLLGHLAVLTLERSAGIVFRVGTRLQRTGDFVVVTIYRFHQLPRLSEDLVEGNEVIGNGTESDSDHDFLVLRVFFIATGRTEQLVVSMRIAARSLTTTLTVGSKAWYEWLANCVIIDGRSMALTPSPAPDPRAFILVHDVMARRLQYFFKFVLARRFWPALRAETWIDFEGRNSIRMQIIEQSCEHGVTCYLLNDCVTRSNLTARQRRWQYNDGALKKKMMPVFFAFVSTIQRHVRGFIARARLYRWHVGAVQLQRLWRGVRSRASSELVFLRQCTAEAKRDAIVHRRIARLQAYYRGAQVRAHYDRFLLTLAHHSGEPIALRGSVHNRSGWYFFPLQTHESNSADSAYLPSFSFRASPVLEKKNRDNDGPAFRNLKKIRNSIVQGAGPAPLAKKRGRRPSTAPGRSVGQLPSDVTSAVADYRNDFRLKNLPGPAHAQDFIAAAVGCSVPRRNSLPAAVIARSPSPLFPFRPPERELRVSRPGSAMLRRSLYASRTSPSAASSVTCSGEMSQVEDMGNDSPQLLRSGSTEVDKRSSEGSGINAENCGNGSGLPRGVVFYVQFRQSSPPAAARAVFNQDSVFESEYKLPQGTHNENWVPVVGPLSFTDWQQLVVAAKRALQPLPCPGTTAGGSGYYVNGRSKVQKWLVTAAEGLWLLEDEIFPSPITSRFRYCLSASDCSAVVCGNRGINRATEMRGIQEIQIAGQNVARYAPGGAVEKYYAVRTAAALAREGEAGRGVIDRYLTEIDGRAFEVTTEPYGRRYFIPVGSSRSMAEARLPSSHMHSLRGYSENNRRSALPKAEKTLVGEKYPPLSDAAISLLPLPLLGHRFPRYPSLDETLDGINEAGKAMLPVHVCPHCHGSGVTENNIFLREKPETAGLVSDVESDREERELIVAVWSNYFSSLHLRRKPAHGQPIKSSVGNVAKLVGKDGYASMSSLLRITARDVNNGQVFILKISRGLILAPVEGRYLQRLRRLISTLTLKQNAFDSVGFTQSRLMLTFRAVTPPLRNFPLFVRNPIQKRVEFSDGYVAEEEKRVPPGHIHCGEPMLNELGNSLPTLYSNLYVAGFGLHLRRYLAKVRAWKSKLAEATRIRRKVAAPGLLFGASGWYALPGELVAYYCVLKYSIPITEEENTSSSQKLRSPKAPTSALFNSSGLRPCRAIERWFCVCPPIRWNEYCQLLRTARRRGFGVALPATGTLDGHDGYYMDENGEVARWEVDVQSGWTFYGTKYRIETAAVQLIQQLWRQFKARNELRILRRISALAQHKGRIFYEATPGSIQGLTGWYVEVSTSDLLGFKSMLLKQTPNSKLSPIKMLPCDINCNKNHGASDVGALCFECGREWGQHSGHRCIMGDRGSWNVPVCFPSSISMRELFGKTSISSQLLHFIDIQEKSWKLIISLTENQIVGLMHKALFYGGLVACPGTNQGCPGNYMSATGVVVNLDLDSTSGKLMLSDRARELRASRLLNRVLRVALAEFIYRRRRDKRREQLARIEQMLPENGKPKQNGRRLSFRKAYRLITYQRRSGPLNDVISRPHAKPLVRSSIGEDHSIAALRVQSAMRGYRARLFACALRVNRLIDCARPFDWPGNGNDLNHSGWYTFQNLDFSAIQCPAKFSKGFSSTRELFCTLRNTASTKQKEGGVFVVYIAWIPAKMMLSATSSAVVNSSKAFESPGTWKTLFGPITWGLWQDACSRATKLSEPVPLAQCVSTMDINHENGCFYLGADGSLLKGIISASGINKFLELGRGMVPSLRFADQRRAMVERIAASVGWMSSESEKRKEMKRRVKLFLNVVPPSPRSAFHGNYIVDQFGRRIITKGKAIYRDGSCETDIFFEPFTPLWCGNALLGDYNVNMTVSSFGKGAEKLRVRVYDWQAAALSDPRWQLQLNTESKFSFDSFRNYNYSARSCEPGKYVALLVGEKKVDVPSAGRINHGLQDLTQHIFRGKLYSGHIYELLVDRGLLPDPESMLDGERWIRQLEHRLQVLRFYPSVDQGWLPLRCKFEVCKSELELMFIHQAQTEEMRKRLFISSARTLTSGKIISTIRPRSAQRIQSLWRGYKIRSGRLRQRAANTWGSMSIIKVQTYSSYGVRSFAMDGAYPSLDSYNSLCSSHKFSWKSISRDVEVFSDCKFNNSKDRLLPVAQFMPPSFVVGISPRRRAVFGRGTRRMHLIDQLGPSSALRHRLYARPAVLSSAMEASSASAADSKSINKRSSIVKCKSNICMHFRAKSKYLNEPWSLSRRNAIIPGAVLRTKGCNGLFGLNIDYKTKWRMCQGCNAPLLADVGTRQGASGWYFWPWKGQMYMVWCEVFQNEWALGSYPILRSDWLRSIYKAKVNGKGLAVLPSAPPHWDETNQEGREAEIGVAAPLLNQVRWRRARISRWNGVYCIDSLKRLTFWAAFSEFGNWIPWVQYERERCARVIQNAFRVWRFTTERCGGMQALRAFADPVFKQQKNEHARGSALGWSTRRGHSGWYFRARTYKNSFSRERPVYYFVVSDRRVWTMKYGPLAPTMLRQLCLRAIRLGFPVRLPSAEVMVPIRESSVSKASQMSGVVTKSSMKYIENLDGSRPKLFVTSSGEVTEIFDDDSCRRWRCMEQQAEALQLLAAHRLKPFCDKFKSTRPGRSGWYIANDTPSCLMAVDEPYSLHNIDATPPSGGFLYYFEVFNGVWEYVYGPIAFTTYESIRQQTEFSKQAIALPEAERFYKVDDRLIRNYFYDDIPNGASIRENFRDSVQGALCDEKCPLYCGANGYNYSSSKFEECNSIAIQSKYIVRPLGKFTVYLDPNGHFRAKNGESEAERGKYLPTIFQVLAIHMIQHYVKRWLKELRSGAEQNVIFTKPSVEIRRDNISELGEIRPTPPEHPRLTHGFEARKTTFLNFADSVYHNGRSNNDKVDEVLKIRPSPFLLPRVLWSSRKVRRARVVEKTMNPMLSISKKQQISNVSGSSFDTTTMLPPSRVNEPRENKSELFPSWPNSFEKQSKPVAFLEQISSIIQTDPVSTVLHSIALEISATPPDENPKNVLPQVRPRSASSKLRDPSEDFTGLESHSVTTTVDVAPAAMVSGRESIHSRASPQNESNTSEHRPSEFRVSSPELPQKEVLLTEVCSEDGDEESSNHDSPSGNSGSVIINRGSRLFNFKGRNDHSRRASVLRPASREPPSQIMNKQGRMVLTPVAEGQRGFKLPAIDTNSRNRDSAPLIASIPVVQPVQFEQQAKVLIAGAPIISTAAALDLATVSSHRPESIAPISGVLIKEAVRMVSLNSPLRPASRERREAVPLRPDSRSSSIIGSSATSTDEMFESGSAIVLKTRSRHFALQQALAARSNGL